MIYPSSVQTPQSVAAHYDELDFVYREVWGEHVHHGYWESGGESAEEAVEKLIELVVTKVALKKGDRVCDIGCGYGGTARYLTRHYQAQVTGFSVSEKQLTYARGRSEPSAGPRFILGDWLENSLDSSSFDVALSIESSEHMPDKARFFSESFRVLKKGGRFATCAWLASETPKPWHLKHLLEPICREGRLPSMGTQSDYFAMIQDAGFQAIQFHDISAQVSKTWWICIQRFIFGTFTKPKYRKILLNREFSNRVFAKTLLRMLVGYKTGALRYGVFSARKN